MSSKIERTHLDRRAVVYLRQSGLAQVRQHTESTSRQYDLRSRALDLGWRAEDVDVIDEDLGQSGQSGSWRTGFQKLSHDVANGRVGAIFAVEVSRVARSGDWHQLIDLCRLADVVIADEQSVFSLKDHNDRLLLGIKGTMSEAELDWMRLRLDGGKLSKARRGELRLRPPVGYVWDAASRRFRIDPEEAVQEAVRAIFRQFRITRSAYGVLRYFNENGLRIPWREQRSGELTSSTPRHSLVVRVLKSPVYAGAYVYGRREMRMALVDGQVRRKRVRSLPASEWKVRLRDQHPGYISWVEFMANQKQLQENRTNLGASQARGASREGEALLQGLVLCGECGHRMGVRYRGKRSSAQYECRNIARHVGGGRLCWTVPARPVDAAVVALALEAMRPPEIELSLAVAREAERHAQEIDQQWKLRLDRVDYEAELAERRYKSIDPDNRTVSRTLAREWEEKLNELREAQAEHQEVRRREKAELTEADRARIRALAKDLRQVWNLPTTTNSDRKNLLRFVINEVALKPIDVPTRCISVRVLWVTGAVTELRVDRRRGHPATCVERQRHRP